MAGIIPVGTVPAQAVAFMAGTQATTGDPVPVRIVAPAAATGLVTDFHAGWTAVAGTGISPVVTWMTLRPAFVTGTGLGEGVPQVG
jgi:hypothetical protein